MLFIIAIVAAIIAFVVYLNAKKRFSKSESTFALAGMSVAIVIALLQVWTVIPAGHAGVIDFLGYVSDNTLKPGVNIVNPLANVIKFDTRKQELRESMTVPSKEGLSVELEISLIFKLSMDKVNEIYKTVGDFEEYQQKLVLPNFRSVVRGVTTRFEAKSLYTADREKLEAEIRENLSLIREMSEVVILSTPLRQIVLPPGLTASIEEKLKAEQESQRMEFVLTREKQEADRKRIEAQGIADFQDIVSKGISEQLLKWKGIEATEKLASSNNAKIVVIGSGKDGLPLILNGQ
ncbi:MAG: prohibitin family protein [Ignavibacteriaceae bacterium]|nr:prohibitin family protein [Ignavibacteriaceae bacterium]